MQIGALQKVSLIEYPGKICAVVFTQGCNFKCPYCHNPELVKPDLYGECLREDEILSFLEKRRGKLDAVNITGGEPTIQHDLIDFVKRVKKKGYLVKVDSNGSVPEVLKALIKGKEVDYIAMDIKGPLDKYNTITRSQIQEDVIKESIEIIMRSDVPYEFRTTVSKSLLGENDLLEIGNLIRNARLYILQQFVPSKTLDKKFMKEETYSRKELESIAQKLIRKIPQVLVR
ncbi:MAG: anaerobic ribonucleoside-triphosphate reductase activating protein [Deltaproteobacteria bacterium]|nr:anaerobic ribonucleoside-triphosphate reductase activating protein [Deltaproteobacteria bacterium]